jgi:hypothetical protein
MRARQPTMPTPLPTSSFPDTIAAARVFLDAALREEGDALATACEAVNTAGRASVRGADALRCAQAAHARTSAAISSLRALKQADTERIDAAILLLQTNSASRLPAGELLAPAPVAFRRLRAPRAAH